MAIWVSPRRRHRRHRPGFLQATIMTEPKTKPKPEPKGLGILDGKTHVLPISVYYEDTDLSGFVYHANYLRYMERGRTEFFRLSGISKMAGLEEDEPTAWAIRSIRVDYFRPARLDDVIQVRTTLVDL